MRSGAATGLLLPETRVVEHKTVCAETSGENGTVAVGTEIQVVADGIEHIVAIAAVEGIGEGAARTVGRHTAIQRIVADPATQTVGVRVAVQPIGTVAAIQRVVAITAMQLIVIGIAIELVVAGAAIKNVVTRRRR
jgi:hypothetical protein